MLVLVIIVFVLGGKVLSDPAQVQLPNTQPPLSPVASASPSNKIVISSLPPVSVSATGSSEILGVNNRERATVARVVDGDTIKLSDGRTVRYIGIDTPETVKPQASVGCFGKEASDANNLLVTGKEIEIEKDVSDTDRYGRLLRYVYVDGVFVNLYLVEHGFAYAAKFPPDIKHAELFKATQLKAENSGVGLWGARC